MAFDTIGDITEIRSMWNSLLDCRGSVDTGLQSAISAASTPGIYRIRYGYLPGINRKSSFTICIDMARMGHNIARTPLYEKPTS